MKEVEIMSSDINYIIQMSLNGDKNCQEILLQKLRPLIYKNIYMYWGTSDPDTEDLAQEGYALILESLKSYDEKYNVHFLQHAKTKIIYFYKNYYRKSKKQKNEINITENICYNDEKSALDLVITGEEITELLNNLKKLNIKEQKIIYLYYQEQLPLTEISKNLNIPYRTALGRKQTALKKLKQLITSGR